MITLPPGLLLAAIQKGGWTYDGRDYPGLPDVYASVNLGHLKKLKQAGLMDQHAIYMHNEMVLMVAKGNPKNIRGIADLARADVRTSMPNPVNEGIMQFYGRKVLERHGLWQKISAGKECFSCQTTPNNWFTAVHHRETPERIRDGKSDTGIVWVTEAIEARARQRAGGRREAAAAGQPARRGGLRDRDAHEQPAQGERPALPRLSRHPGGAGRVRQVRFRERERRRTAAQADSLKHEARDDAHLRRERTPHRRSLNFADTESFDDAHRGFVGTIPDARIERADGRVVWDLSSFAFLDDERAPDTVNPSLWRQARLNRIHGLFEVCDAHLPGARLRPRQHDDHRGRHRRRS